MHIRAVQVKNLKERVGLIHYYIREGRKDVRVRQLASAIINRKCGRDWCIAEKDWYGEVRAIWDYLRQNVRYTLDPYSLELFQRARRSLELGTADCDDLVILAGSLLQVIGYPVRIVIVDTSGDGWNHVYLSVGMPPTGPMEWIPFDLAATNKDLGWEPPASMVARKKMFEIPEED